MSQFHMACHSHTTLLLRKGLKGSEWPFIHLAGGWFLLHLWSVVGRVLKAAKNGSQQKGCYDFCVVKLLRTWYFSECNQNIPGLLYSSLIPMLPCLPFFHFTGLLAPTYPSRTWVLSKPIPLGLPEQPWRSEWWWAGFLLVLLLVILPNAIGCF